MNNVDDWNLLGDCPELQKLWNVDDEGGGDGRHEVVERPLLHHRRRIGIEPSRAPVYLDRGADGLEATLATDHERVADGHVPDLNGCISLTGLLPSSVTR